MLEALAEIRREARKAALVQAAIDAMLVFVVCRLLIQLFAIEIGSGVIVSVPLPGGLTNAFSGIGVVLPNPVTISGAGFVVILTAGSWFVADTVIRYERLDVERFEAGNPTIDEALRTARDSVGREVDTPVAAELYRDVLEHLEATSSKVFIQRRQLVGIVVAIAVCSTATVAVAGVGLSPIGPTENSETTAEIVDGGGGSGEVAAGAGGSSGTGSSNDLLGDEGEVERGTEDRALQFRGEGEGSAGSGGDYSGGSFDVDTADVDTSSAEFTNENRPEEADLVRAYNERVRGEGTD
jgi:hypothetical protein